MKILFCGNAPLTKRLGASKVLLELAAHMQPLGWETTVIGPEDLERHRVKGDQCLPPWLAFRHYLAEIADQYDVIDYDHEMLPFSRRSFSSRPLFVARSVLLAHHLKTIRLPNLPGTRAYAGRIIHGYTRRKAVHERIERAQQTVLEADLVNVCNDDDKRALIRCGIQADKIVVLPFGLSSKRIEAFAQAASVPPAVPRICFVGTFDPRKGSREFPSIVEAIAARVPEVQCLLVGTRGLLRSSEAVRRSFPRRLRHRIDIYEEFRPEDLPELLHDASVGVFPSYMEGFPFGVLEMLAASIPVVAYAAPGATMMLPPDWLVPTGDTNALSHIASQLLRDRVTLAEARARAKEISYRFSWEKAARSTSDLYLRELRRRRGSAALVADREHAVAWVGYR